MVNVRSKELWTRPKSYITCATSTQRTAQIATGGPTSHAEVVDQALHTAGDVERAGEDVGEEEEDADAAAELRPQRPTDHVCVQSGQGIDTGKWRETVVIQQTRNTKNRQVTFRFISCVDKNCYRTVSGLSTSGGCNDWQG